MSPIPNTATKQLVRRLPPHMRTAGLRTARALNDLMRAAQRFAAAEIALKAAGRKAGKK